MPFKGISYLDIWPFCSAECNHLCNFGRGYYEEQFFEKYFEFGSVVQEQLLFKSVFYYSCNFAQFKLKNPHCTQVPLTASRINVLPLLP